MKINPKSDLIKPLLIFLEVTVFLAVLVHVARTAVADQVAAKSTIPDLEFAIKLDPSDSEYERKLGRLLRYNYEQVDPQKALAHLKRAVELSPCTPQVWLDLAAFLEFQGKLAEAEASLRRASSLAPNLPDYQWVIGNFFLLHGGIDDAFRAFRTVLAGTGEYDRALFDTAWKASGDGRKILNELIPDRISTEFSYLSYLTFFKHYTEAQEVWKRIAASPETYPPSFAARYLDTLIEIHQPDLAYQVWSDLRNKGLIRPTYEATKENLVMNGDFEDDLLMMGFDWRVDPVDGAYAGLDRTEFHSPSHSLMVQFAGKQNLNFRGVYQYVRVQPGRAYHFRAFVKTEAITTDSGPRVEIRDAYNPALVDRFSDNFVGNSGGWRQVNIDFAAGAQSTLLVVDVIRPPSQKIDNRIAGKIWIDDVSLTPLSGTVRAAQ